MHTYTHTHTYEKFSDQATTKLTLDGRTLRLPGIGPGASAASRAEALRVFLEDRLGADCFVRAYRFMQAIREVRAAARECVGVAPNKACIVF